MHMLLSFSRPTLTVKYIVFFTEVVFIIMQLFLRQFHYAAELENARNNYLIRFSLGFIPVHILDLVLQNKKL